MPINFALPRSWPLMFAVTSVLCCGGCSLGDFAQSSSKGFGVATCASVGEEAEIIYLSNLGWHTGLVLPSALARTMLEVELGEFDRSSWVEFGWGDRDFYRSSGYSYWAGVQALFFSSGSAIHVTALPTSPKQFFKDSQLCEVTIAKSRLPLLMSFVRDHLVLDQDGRAIRLGDGLYGDGSFYDGRGDFSLLYTCNSWTAEALKIIGCDIEADLIRASSVYGAICPNLSDSTGSFNRGGGTDKY